MLDILTPQQLMLGPIASTFLLGITTLVLLFWYAYRKQRYWKDRGIPSVKSWPFLGSVTDVLRKPLHEIEIDRYKEYGKIYGQFEGNRPVLSIADPEMIKQILVKDFHAFPARRDFSVGEKKLEKMLSVVTGEDWKRIRTVVSPTFTTGKIKRMISIFKECSQTLVKSFEKSEGKPVEVKGLYGAFTMDIIASSAFSTKIDSHNDPNNEFVKNAKEFFSNNINWRFFVLLAFPWLVKLFKLRIFPEEALKFFTNVTLQIIEERKRTGQTRNDFLQLLLDTSKEAFSNYETDANEKDDIAENYGKEENDIFKQNAYSKKTLSYDEVIAQCLIFFLAGYDTTASTMSLASYNLALNPDAQEKLIQEIDDALSQNNGELTYEAIQNMKYLDNVISETLRMYPPLSRLERTAAEDYYLKDIGITIPKGMVVGIPAQAIHLDPEFYPNPEKFDPDRFTPEERAKRDQYTYLPFGHGPRNCVGMRFALMEIKVCLATVLSKFRITTCSETKVPLIFNPGQGLLQPKDVTLILKARTDAAKETQE